MLQITDVGEVKGIMLRTHVGNAGSKQDIFATLATALTRLYRDAYGIGCNMRIRGKYYYGSRNEYSGGIPIELVSSRRDNPGIAHWQLVIRTDIDSTLGVTPGYDCVVAACGDLTMDVLEELAWLSDLGVTNNVGL